MNADCTHRPVVPAGACAEALRTSAGESLAVAVARQIFITRIAPGLIITTARYVMRAAAAPVEALLDPLVANHLLPPPDHLSSLPRLLARAAHQHGGGVMAASSLDLTDDELFRLVRMAFLGYNYKSVGYRQAIDPDGPLHHVWHSPAVDPSPRRWLEEHGRSWPMKNRHGAQAPPCYIDWDQRLCAAPLQVAKAARAGEPALRRLLNEPLSRGGLAKSPNTLLCTRVPALLSAAGVVRTPSRRPDEPMAAPCGGRGSRRAIACSREAVATYLETIAAESTLPTPRAALCGLAGTVRALSDQEMADGLAELLEAEPLLAHQLVDSVLTPPLAAWRRSVAAVLPRAYSPCSCELLWCEYVHRFDTAMRSGHTHMPRLDSARLADSLPCTRRVNVPIRRDAWVDVCQVDLDPLLPATGEWELPTHPVPRQALVYELSTPPARALCGWVCEHPPGPTEPHTASDGLPHHGWTAGPEGAAARILTALGTAHPAASSTAPGVAQLASPTAQPCFAPPTAPPTTATPAPPPTTSAKNVGCIWTTPPPAVLSLRKPHGSDGDGRPMESEPIITTLHLGDEGVADTPTPDGAVPPPLVLGTTVAPKAIVAGPHRNRRRVRPTGVSTPARDPVRHSMRRPLPTPLGRDSKPSPSRPPPHPPITPQGTPACTRRSALTPGTRVIGRWGAAATLELLRPAHRPVTPAALDHLQKIRRCPFLRGTVVQPITPDTDPAWCTYRVVYDDGDLEDTFGHYLWDEAAIASAHGTPWALRHAKRWDSHRELWK